MNKKIIILTSPGGGGHISASTALETYLCNNYEVTSVYVFQDILRSLDIFPILTFNRYSGEDFFNFFIPKKYYQLLGGLYSFGVWYINFMRKKIHATLRDYFIQTKPALIISVIPILNDIVLEVAQELNIPFLLIPADLDATMYIGRITKPSYKQFYIGLAFEDEDIMKSVNNALIPKDQLFIIGAPLRPAFFALKDKTALKEKYTIDSDKPVIMLLMGSRGSCETEKYTTKLMTIQSPIHLIVCIGKNENSKKPLASLIIPSHITMSIIDFTDHIADYMKMSDMLISKSGSQSVSEALYMNMPTLLDATSSLLPWEAFNHIFITKHHFGGQIKHYDQVLPQISILLENHEKLLFYRNNLEKLQKKNCEKEIITLIQKILN